jgi:hypothetical protein
VFGSWTNCGLTKLNESNIFCFQKIKNKYLLNSFLHASPYSNRTKAMSKEFMMPGEPDELWLEDSELPMKVQNLLDFSGGCNEDIGEIAEGMPCFLIKFHLPNRLTNAAISLFSFIEHRCIFQAL